MITIIVGTNRPDANSRKIAHQLLKCYRAEGVAAGLLDLADLPAALFAPAASAEKPAAGFARFTQVVF